MCKTPPLGLYYVSVPLSIDLCFLLSRHDKIETHKQHIHTTTLVRYGCYIVSLTFLFILIYPDFTEENVTIMAETSIFTQRIAIKYIVICSIVHTAELFQCNRKPSCIFMTQFHSLKKTKRTSTSLFVVALFYSVYFMYKIRCCILSPAWRMKYWQTFASKLNCLVNK